MKSLDWTKWSAIAEIFSSVAILVTLIYLAIQTQQNTAAILGSPSTLEFRLLFSVPEAERSRWLSDSLAFWS